MKNIVLFQEKKDCCGCGACMNICPKQAIHMLEDEYGFLYPSIEQDKCVRCGRCKKACSYKRSVKNTLTKETYVALAKDNNILKKSASGGVFSAIATEVLQNGGVVFGCSMEYHGCSLNPEHIMIDRIEDLIKLQGSKYVQSYIGTSYQQVKLELERDKLVLFSGTPCQIGGLASYLDNKQYDNLLTIDIICHGTPSSKLFKSYISVLEKKLKGKITGFRFRDKADGWGLTGCVEFTDKRGAHKKKLLPTRMSSYYTFFLQSDTYRENCYDCKYASPHRVGDLTIGDYWGIEKEHPEYLSVNGGLLDEKKGISCVLVNTEQGKRMLEKFHFGLQMNVSTYEKVANQNRQLKQPSHRSEKRKMLLEMYKEHGYTAVDDWYYKELGFMRYMYVIWNMVPRKIQAKIKKMV